MQRKLRANRGVAWIELLVIGLIVLTLVAIFVPAILRARDASRRTQSKNNLKQIGLALHNYHDVYSSFPPGAIVPADSPPRWGWTYSIIPFMFSGPFYNSIDGNLEWNDVTNQSRSSTTIRDYLNPSETRMITSDGYPLIHYTMNSSIGFRNSSLTISDFPERTSNTWMCSEIAGNYRPWAEPVHWRELDQPLNSSDSGLGRPGGDGVLMLLADGSVRDLTNEAYPGVRKSLSGALPLPDLERRRISDRRATDSDIMQLGTADER